jgi:hypothetical protein
VPVNTPAAAPTTIAPVAAPTRATGVVAPDTGTGDGTSGDSGGTLIWLALGLAATAVVVGGGAVAARDR